MGEILKEGMDEKTIENFKANGVEINKHENELTEEDYEPSSLQNEKEEWEILEDMKKKLVSLGLEEIPDDRTLFRFLRARNFKTNRASNMYYKCVQWRSKFMPSGVISDEEVSTALNDEKAYLQCGPGQVPVVILKACKHNAYSRDFNENARLAVYSMEKTIANLPPGIEKFNVITDFDAITLRNLDSSIMIFVFEILKEYYPERLEKLYMIHVPIIFWGIWKIVSPFIDPVTRKKIHFIEDKNLVETLQKEIPPELLPKEYGGSAELKLIQDA